MSERTSRNQLFFIFAIAVFFAGIHLCAVSGYWKVTPDSTMYVGAAKSLAEGHGYRVDGRPLALFPPGTSLLLAIPLRFSKDFYFGMNLLTTLFAIFSIPVVYFWARRDTDKIIAALISTTTISSVFLFQEATYLLSDVFYLTISVFVLYLFKSKSVETGGPTRSLLLAAGTLIAACMVRIAGVTIAAAVLMQQLVSWRKRGAAVAFRWSFVLASVAALLTVAVWEYRTANMGLSYIENALLLEPWVEDKGLASITDILARLPHNAPDYRTIGQVLTNDAFQLEAERPEWVQPLLNFLVVPIFLWGFLSRLISWRHVDEIYLAIYLLVIGTYYSYIDARMFLPILPLILACTIHGAGDLIGRVRKLNPRFAGVLTFVGLIWVSAYLTTSAVRMVRLVPAERASEFGSYPIKYEGHSDAQFLAMWLQQNTPEGSRFLCLHPNIMNVIAERPGFKFPLTPDHRKVLDFIGKSRVEYIIADRSKPEVNEMLLPAIEEAPADIELLMELRDASLYRVIAPFVVEPD